MEDTTQLGNIILYIRVSFTHHSFLWSVKFDLRTSSYLPHSNVNLVPVTAFFSSNQFVKPHIFFAPIRAIRAASSIGLSTSDPVGISNWMNSTNSFGYSFCQAFWKLKYFLWKKLNKRGLKLCHSPAEAFWRDSVGGRTRIPATRFKKLCTAVVGGNHINTVDEAAAVAEQRQPPVIEFRRHKIEQLRLFEATLYDDSLLVLAIVRYWIIYYFYLRY